MSIILVYMIDDNYAIGGDARIHRHADIKSVPRFNIVIESETDLMSLPRRLFDVVVRSLVLDIVDIPEITTGISTLLASYRDAPKKEAI